MVSPLRPGADRAGEQGQRGAPARRTKLGDDGNQMQADGNSFLEFILGWTIGAIGV